MEQHGKRSLTPMAAAAEIEGFLSAATAEENQWLHHDTVLSLRTVISRLKEYQSPFSSKASASATASPSSRDTLPAVSLPVRTSNVELPVYLSPSYLAQPLEGVREQLNRSVLRYVEPLGGVLLSYANLRLKFPLGRISHDAPEVHVRVQFKASFFAPRRHNLLEGTVSRIGGDHIGLLTLGVFNASVAHPTGSQQVTLRADDAAVFVVRSVSEAAGLLSMHGDLMAPGSFHRMSLAATPNGALSRAGRTAAPAATMATPKAKPAAAEPAAQRTPAQSPPSPHGGTPRSESEGGLAVEAAREVDREEKKRRKERKAERAAARLAAVAAAGAASTTPTTAASAAASSAAVSSAGSSAGGSKRKSSAAAAHEAAGGDVVAAGEGAGGGLGAGGGGADEERRAEKTRRKAEKAARKAVE